MKQKLLNVIPECFVDTNLIEYLIGQSVNHQHCCSKVVETMQKKYNDSFAIGIIDKDKVELGYIGQCDLLAQREHISLYKHKVHHHYLITIAPAVDRFVLDCAKDQCVVLDDFDLPSELKAFTKETKQVTSSKDSRFKALFSAIQSNAEMSALRNVLNYLINSKYQTNIDFVKTVFVR